MILTAVMKPWRNYRATTATANILGEQIRRCRSSSSTTHSSTVARTDLQSDVSSTVVRHGPGDCVIKLNVGGKEFVTLKSTIDSNIVLRDYVNRAMSNGEYTDSSCAVFIDRDPTHFGLILTFLRNQIEGIAYNSSTYHTGTITIAALHKNPKYVRLPKGDAGVLQDLYVEATHYQIFPLQRQLCHQSALTYLFSFSGQNPFEQANTFFKQLTRLGTVALVGGTGSVLASLNDGVDGLLGFHVKLPLASERAAETSKPNSDSDGGEFQVAA